MIVKDKMAWLRMLVSFKGSSFEETWPRVLAATTIAGIVTYVELHYGFEKYTLTTTPFTLVGVALGVFLGFRNNEAYDRFWEGRKLWGALVNTSRSMARQAFSLFVSDGDDQELHQFRESYVKRVIAFVHAFRHRLRDTDPIDDISPFLSADDLDEARQAKHRPLIILQQLGRDMANAKERGWLSGMGMLAVDGQLVELSNILGACERIKYTPIPFTYTVLIHRIVLFYCLFLPFGLVDTTRTLTPIVVFLISHAFFGLDAIGEEIEEPFGTLPNHLPLTTISKNIEINLLELLGEPDLPAPVQPENGILM